MALRRGLFLPGYACTASIWQPVAERLAGFCACERVEWPIALLPGFMRVADFGDWLCSTYALRDYDFIAGHSMGGLVALHAAEALPHDATVILVETFLLPPPQFFRNLLLTPDASPAVRAVPEMLAREGAHYAPMLRESLRAVDLRAQVLALPQRVCALYGDRGSGDIAAVRDALAWPADLAARVPVRAVPSACHFPMLENVDATSEAIRTLTG